MISNNNNHWGADGTVTNLDLWAKEPAMTQKGFMRGRGAENEGKTGDSSKASRQEGSRGRQDSS